MTPEQAVQILRSVRNLLREKLRWITEEPWEVECEGDTDTLEPTIGYNIRDVAEATEYPYFCIYKEQDAIFISLARIAIPATLKAIEAVLKSATVADEFEGPEGYYEGIDDIVIPLAEKLSVLLPGKKLNEGENKSK